MALFGGGAGQMMAARTGVMQSRNPEAAVMLDDYGETLVLLGVYVGLLAAGAAGVGSQAGVGASLGAEGGVGGLSWGEVLQRAVPLIQARLAEHGGEAAQVLSDDDVAAAAGSALSTVADGGEPSGAVLVLIQSLLAAGAGEVVTPGDVTDALAWRHETSTGRPKAKPAALPGRHHVLVSRVQARKDFLATPAGRKAIDAGGLTDYRDGV